MRRTRPLVICLMLVAILVAGSVAQHFRLFERTWFQISLLWQPTDPAAINLGQYRAVLQGKKIDGLDLRPAAQKLVYGHQPEK